MVEHFSIMHPNSEYFRNDDKFNPEVISDDECEEYLVNFYLLTVKQDPKTAFRLKFRNLHSLREPVKMTKLDNNIFYLLVKIPASELKNITDVKYSYLKSTESISDENQLEGEETEQEKQRPKKFLRLKSFFDIFQNKKQLINQLLPNQKKEYYEAFIRFLFSNYEDKQSHHGSPLIFQEFQEFIQYEGGSYPFSQTLKILTQMYLNIADDDELNIYVFEFFSYYDLKKLQGKEDTLRPLLNRMVQIQFGFLRRIILKNQNEINHPSIVKGFKNLMALEPFLGLEFFDLLHFIPDKKKFLTKNISIKDEFRFNKFKDVIKNARTFDTYQDPESVQLLIYHALMESKSFDYFLENAEDLKEYAADKCILKACKDFKKKQNRSYNYSNFIKEYLERLLLIPQFKNVFATEIRECFKIYLKANNNNPDNKNNIDLNKASYYSQLLLQNSDLVTFLLLDEIVHYATNHHLQTNFMELLINHLAQAEEQKSFKEVKKIINYNFYSVQRLAKNIPDQYQIMSKFVDYLNNPIFKQMNDFDSSQIHHQMIKHMFTLFRQQYSIEWLLQTLIKVRQNPEEDPIKIKLFADVIFMVSKEQTLDDKNIKSILLHVFPKPSYSLKFQELKQIGDLALTELGKLFEKEKRNLYDDNLILTAIKIGQQYQENEILVNIRKRISDFISRLKDQTITLKEVNQTIISNKKNLKEIILIFDPSFDIRLLEEIHKINQSFKLNIEKYQNYILWAQKSQLNVHIKTYTGKLNQIIYSQDNLEIKRAKSPDQFSHFQNLQTVDRFYFFRDSKVFENLFNSLPQVIQENNVQFEQSKDTETGVFQVRVEGYDKAAAEYLFGKILHDHLKSLAEYPGKQIMNCEIQSFWNNIRPENVDSELTLINEYLQKHQQKNSNYYIQAQSLNQQLFVDLKNYTKQEQFRARSEIINNLEIYQRKNGQDGVESSDALKRMIQFQDDYKNSNPQESLEKISQRANKIYEDFQNIDQYYQIQWNLLEEYVRSRDTFEFCIKESGYDFNTLYEYMDDSATMNNRTIESLNAASVFFLDLYNKIQKMGSNEFERVLQILSSEMYQQIQKDSEFLSKLVNCNSNLQEIKHMTSSSRNASENTLQIIEDALQYGTFIFAQQKKKFNFILEIRIPNKNQTQQQLERSAFENDELIAENQIRKIIKLSKDKIYQHSSRAKLFIHSKKTSQIRQQEVIEIDRIFTESVDLCTKILQYILDLNHYGHLDYQKDQEFFKIPIFRNNIVSDLTDRYKQLKDQFEGLKRSLETQRKRFYFLNYVPNHLVAQLNYPFRDFNQLQQVLHKLEEIKVFPRKIQIQANHQNNLEILSELQKNWELQNLKSVEQDGSTQFIKDYGYQLQSGRVQHKVVPDNLSLIKAICSIFAIAKMYPSFDRVLICEKETQLIELQTFVNRSVMFPQDPKASKPFVIANFQKLPFSTQQLCYDYILQYQGQYQMYNSNFTLYILSVQLQNQDSRLIELLRNSQSFLFSIKEDNLKDYFQNYHNIKIVKAPYCGLGKTQFIRNQAKKDQSNILRIPIYGEINKQKFIKIFKHNQQLLPRDKKYIIHYDVYPCGKEDLNVILFELLILKCLNNHFQEIYQIPQSPQVRVEISYQLNDKLPSLFINENLKNKEQRWDFMSIDVKLDANDKFQKVSRYLKALSEKPKLYNPGHLIDPPHILTDGDCHIILRSNFSRLLKAQNYYFVNSFVDFVCDQIRRMEQSIFFRQDYLESQMTGLFGREKKARKFHREIISQLITLSQRISIVERYNEAHEVAQNLERRNLEEEQATRFREIEWDVYKNPFIVFNDGGNITPIYRDVKNVPEAIVEYHKMANRLNRSNQNLKLYDELTQDEFIEKILEICVSDARREKIRKMKDLKSLVFTLDNFMKLVLIYLRIRNFMPIVLMGETGVGKTSLVEYLSKIIDAEFLVLNVHAGITESNIIQFVEKAQKIALSQQLDNNQKKLPLQQMRKVILFFDEINTNENINGLLKEIFIDRHLNGIPLQENICLVAACNPFKLRPKEVTGLTSGFRINDRDPTMSRLVYRVIPLPESLVPFIWDYKSLNINEEKQYIRKMIERTFDEDQIFGHGLNLIYMWIGDKSQVTKQRQISHKLQEEIKNIAETVFRAQNIIKRQEESSWAVSLRDVSRFCKLFNYFNKNNSNRDKNFNPRATISGQKADQQQFGNREIALVLSLYFSYVIRISDYEKRASFIDQIQIELRSQQISIRCLTPENFKQIVYREQDRFINEMEIKKGIGLSQTLRENIFVIITCILTNIPLIITGKPGSSKTLAMNLITKSFKGALSSKPFFQQFPDVVPFYFQGSEQTVSKSIEKVFKKAIKAQKKVKGKNSRMVVVFDEIGLAEQSGHNPLKILHSLLEPPQVAFVGISNWSLDASKMNRVVTLNRYDPDQKDLLETALSIARNYNQNISAQFLLPLVNWYLEYTDKQKRNEQNRDFHGLRDFYSFIKYIASRINGNEENNERVIHKGVTRNFGGLNSNDALALLDDKLNFKHIENVLVSKPDQLIVENLLDQESRHLMIITDNFENTLQFIQDQCQKQLRTFEIFYGSDFPDDQNEDATYEQINEIIFHMESGSLCVFLNLKNVYQSFYDMLNQNYTEIGTQNTQKYSKVAVGADQSLFLVHEKFKCILIVDQKQINELDGPLKNRFEKQLYTEDVSTSLSHRQLKNDLSNWTYQISKIQRFERKQMFPTIDETQSYQQLIIQNREIFGDNEEIIKQESKRSLIRLATFQGIIRSQLSQVFDKENWYQEYFNNQNHFDIFSLLDYYSQNWQDQKCFEKSQGFNLIVYTYSALIDIRRLSQKYKIEKFIELNSIHKKKQYTQLVENFFSKENKNELLLIFADMINVTKNIINLCRSKINSLRNKKSLSEENIMKHVVFIIKIDFTNQNTDHNISFGKDWRQYMVDLLNGQGHQEITIKELFDQNLEVLISESSQKKSIFEQALVEGLSKIFYKKPQGFITDRLQKIQKIFSNPINNEYLTQLIVWKFQKNPIYENIMNSWRVDVVCNDFLMKSNMTFHGAALEFIKTELVNHLAFVISYLEQDGIITSFENKELFEMAKDYFKNLFKKTIINNRFLNVYYLNYNFDKIRFPLARVIHQQFQQLKIQFMKNDKRFNSQKIDGAKTFRYNSDGINLDQIQLEYESLNQRQMSNRQKENERETFLRFKKIIQRDKYLSKNIENLISWCDLYFPKEYINQKILTENNIQYLEDFTYLINSESKNNGDSSTDSYKSYLTNIIRLFLKDKIISDNKMSKSEIYGIYWKHENLFHNVWKIIWENVKQLQFKSYAEMEKLLIKEISEHEHYKNTEIKYLPREAFMQAVIKVFFELYYPSDIIPNNVPTWEGNLKQTFQRLNDLSFYYQGVTQTNESRVIIILLKYFNQITKYQGIKANIQTFINFAQRLKKVFQSPKQLILLILQIMEENWTQYKDLVVKKRIFKIACEYLIESQQLEENIEFDFLINDILAYIINQQKDQYSLYSLQQDESFQFILQNLVSIMTAIIKNQNYGTKEVSCLQKLIEGNFQDYGQNIQAYPHLHLLDEFIIRNQAGITRNDPLMICLTDQLIDFIKYDPFDHFQRIIKALDHIRLVILKTDFNKVSLQQLIAVSAFQKIAIIYVSEIDYLHKEDESNAIELGTSISDFFKCDNQEQRDLMQPFAIYLMKLVYQKFDYERKDRDFIRPFIQWVEDFQKLDMNLDKICFSFIKNSEFSALYNSYLSQSNAIDETAAKKGVMNKFVQILAILDFYYLQRRKQEIPRNQSEVLQKFQLLSQDKELCQFLQPFVDHQFEKTPRNKFLRIDEVRGEKPHIKLLSLMIAAAGFANHNTFIYQFFINPGKIKDSFIPFVQNFHGDTDYQRIFKNNEYLTCLQCINESCKRKTLRIDLQDFSTQNCKTTIQLGPEKRCKMKDPNQNDKICNHKLINQRESLVNQTQDRIKNTNELAEKSYIPFERDEYNIVQIRKLKRHQLAIGRIILHSMLMLNLSFSSQDNTILEIILTDYLYSGKEYEILILDALKYLSFCMNQDWEYLKTEYYLNDEKVVQIIQYVIFEITKSGNQVYLADSLRTIEGRKNFEAHFMLICDKIFPNTRLFLSQTMKNISPLETFLLENNQYQANQYYSLLRSVNQISIQHFERKVIEENNPEINFFKMLFQQKESIKNLRHLHYLVDWARFIFEKYSTQLTLDEVHEMTIKEALERDFQQNSSSKEYQKKKQKDFKKFQQAWNTFAGLIIKDKEVEVVIPEINEQSELMYCCLTKDKKDLKGHIFYILLQYLCKKQNKVLEEAQKLFKEDSVYSIRFPSTYLLNLKKEHIIFLRDKQKPVNKRDRALSQQVSEVVKAQQQEEDALNQLEFSNLLKQPSNNQQKKLEEELFEELIISNSACNLQYSKGMQVEYDIDKIKTQTIEILLKGKHTIILEDSTLKLNFQFLNLGNLYSQFDAIKKIEEQTSLPDNILKTINEFNDIEKLHQLIGQLRITMNYIESSVDEENSKNMELIKFMKALQITKEDNILGYDLKVNNLIALYEALEIKVEENEVKNISPKYQVEFKDYQNIKFGKDIHQLDIQQLEMLSHAVGRLCIRNLKNFSKEYDSKKIFELLLEEKNQNLFLGFIQTMKMKQKKDELTLAELENKNKFSKLREIIQNNYLPADIEIRYAKAAYDRLRQQYQKKVDEEKEKALSLARDRQDRINDERVRNIDINAIMMEETSQQQTTGRRNRRLQ